MNNNFLDKKSTFEKKQKKTIEDKSFDFFGNLRKISLKKTEITTLKELEEDNEMIFNLPKDSIRKNNISDTCPCKICLRAKQNDEKTTHSSQSNSRGSISQEKSGTKIRNKKLKFRMEKVAKIKDQKSIKAAYSENKKTRRKSALKPHLMILKNNMNKTRFKSPKKILPFLLKSTGKQFFFLHFGFSRL